MPAKITSAPAQIAPIIHFPRRDSDCPKCSGLRPLMPPEHKGRRIGPFRVVPAAESVLDREASPGEECQGNREFHGPVGKDVQQQDTYGGGDHHVHGERRGRDQ